MSSLDLVELVRRQRTMPANAAVESAMMELQGSTPGRFVEEFGTTLETRAVEKQKRTFEDPVIWAADRGISLWGRCDCDQCGGWRPEEAQDQIAIWESCRDHRETYVHSGFGTGKTFTGAGLSCWWMDTFSPAIVLTTSSVFLQVRRQMWKDIRRLHMELGLEGDCHQVHWNITPEHYAQGFSTDRIEEMHGFHGAAVLFIIDEAQSQRCRPAFEAAERILTGENDALLSICNPLRKNCVPYERLREDRGNHIRISVLDCLSYQDAHPVRAEGLHELVSWKWMEEEASFWPEHSAKRRIHVHGLYADSDDEYVFPPDLVEESMALWDELAREERLFVVAGEDGTVRAKKKPDQVGVDVAGAGADETIHADRYGNEAIAFSFREAKTDHPVHRRYCEARAKQYGSFHYTWDASGEGSGTYGELRERGVAIDKYTGGGIPVDRNLYYDRLTESYFALKQFMLDGGAIPRSRDLKKQLQSVEAIEVDRTVTIKSGKKSSYKMETTVLRILKRDMVKQLKDSPDESDACALACAPVKSALRRRGFRRHRAR